MRTDQRQGIRFGLRCFIAAALVYGSSGSWSTHAGSIVGSKHDLSIRGAGPIKSPTEREVCIFCHTPHHSAPEAPLWNRFGSGAAYKTYDSTTTKARIGQPNGASKLCLSCHDGTIALGMVRSRKQIIPMAGGKSRLPPGKSNLGIDLSDDHPISFRFDRTLVSADEGELRDPSLLSSRVRLDRDGQVQCTSCHDPHSNDYGDFLVMDNRGSLLCTTCHSTRGWDSSVHRTSTAKKKGGGATPWPHTDYTTVRDNACENCHRPHSAGTPQRLLTFPGEDANCLSCHDGSVAKTDIRGELRKTSIHSTSAQPGVHSPDEDIVNAPRHVTCVDCHDPHATQSSARKVGNVSGALVGVAGVRSGGSVVKSISHEYELCFRCHGDSPKRGPTDIPRETPQTNTRLEFDSSSESYHPVVAEGRNPDVPSLIRSLTASSLIQCTDCHNSDSSPKAGGQGANGPHGSVWEHLLAQRLEVEDGQSENAAAYALCYQCHERASILSDASFPFHKLHIVDERTSCSTCHDPHAAIDNSHLINFNLRYVSPNGSGRLSWEDTGRYAGKCYLSCHGSDHDPLEYPAIGIGEPGL